MAAGIEPESQLIYSSPAIHARRRRILEETRKLIAERGLTGFSMEEICKRANVAKRTLYNAYQTKERMIALAIHEYFERYVDKLRYTSPPGSLQRNIERIVHVIQRNRQIRNYISAIMAIYFNPDADNDIWMTMHSMAVKSNMEWIEVVKSKRQLHPWINVESFVDDLIRLEYAVIHDWCRGLITDELVTQHLVTSWLTFVAGATRGSARKEVDAHLQRIYETGELIPNNADN